MKPTCRVLLLVVAFLLLGVPLRAQAPSVIEPKVERHQGPPLWISAEAVADEEKVVNLDLIRRSILQRYVEQQRRDLADRGPVEKSGGRPAITTIPASECKSELDLIDDRGGSGSSATLSDLAANSESIFRGKIRTIDPGFDGGVPASLLGVEVSEVIKGAAPARPFYILYPVSHFRIGPLHFCNAKKGFEPQVGDDILLFDFTGPADRTGVLYGPRLDQIVFERPTGALILPPQLKDSPDLQPVRNLDEFVDRLRSTLERSVAPRGSAQ